MGIESKICYFRTSVNRPNRKALIQITEKCNLLCKHCFINAKNSGNIITTQNLKTKVIPALKKLNVIKVTITGGEPFMHNEIIDIIKLFSNSGFSVGICTNATLLDKLIINEISGITNIHFNVSLDGFSEKSHETFRGKKDIFYKIIDNIKSLGENNLLQGILVTPNSLADIKEYNKLCLYAKTNNAKYVLFNPLSKLGRGSNAEALAISNNNLIRIKKSTAKLIDETFDISYIRFPDIDPKSCGTCYEGNIFYIFANGDITNCPYVIFSAKSTTGYNYKNFITGNIFEEDINNELFKRENFKNKYNYSGCLSAIITSNNSINNSVDPLLLNEIEMR